VRAAVSGSWRPFVHHRWCSREAASAVEAVLLVGHRIYTSYDRFLEDAEVAATSAAQGGDADAGGHYGGPHGGDVKVITAVPATTDGSKWAGHSQSAGLENASTGTSSDVRLPGLPNELWILVLGMLLSSDMGGGDLQREVRGIARCVREVQTRRTAEEDTGGAQRERTTEDHVGGAQRERTTEDHVGGAQ
jgi:hypothetical protein